jgi:two-component system chemotaxis response regulator CheB
MKKIRVMVVEDSRVVRQFLEHLIRADPRLEVAAAVGSAEEALALLDVVRPDVISMDIRLPGMNGLEATRRIMAERPTPIVVVSASVEADDLHISMNALRAGALAVVEKPTGTRHEDYEALAERLCTQLAIMSQVQVIRQRISRLRSAECGVRSETEEVPASAPAILGSGPSATPQSAIRNPQFKVLAVGASTGGPRALSVLLNGLPAAFPLPVLLVQHITDSFLDGFAAWLGSVCDLPVALACDYEVARAGRVYLPPADHHLRVEGGWLRCERGEPVCAQRPSATVLFRSLARSCGPAALAVLLTGMGEDGAEGLAEVRAAGGYTIAEDESTAVVWGMPGAAVRRGAACAVLPLPDVAPHLLRLVAGRGGGERRGGEK